MRLLGRWTRCADGTAEMLAKEFPDVVHLALKENTGPAGGFAAGMQHAYQAGHGWIWLFNDDALAKPECLGQCLYWVQQVDYERIGILFPQNATNGSVEGGYFWRHGPLQIVRQLSKGAFAPAGAPVKGVTTQ